MRELSQWRQRREELMREAEANRILLRESVKDLALYLGKMSGAKVEVVEGAPAAGDKRVPALWVSARRPRLGWCFQGAPHTWLGSASCGGRVSEPARAVWLVVRAS